MDLQTDTGCNGKDDPEVGGGQWNSVSSDEQPNLLSNITNTEDEVKPKTPNKEGDTAVQESPIMIRSNIAELQGHVRKRILVGNDFTWNEFIETWCEFEMDDEIHCLRGKNNRALDKNSKVGDYVRSIRKKLNVYPIRVEMRKKSPVKRQQQLEEANKPVGEDNKDQEEEEEQEAAGDINLAEAEGASDDVQVQNGCEEMEMEVDSSAEQESMWNSLNSSFCSSNEEEDATVKPSVVQFMATRVTNKDLMKVREELMKLRENDDYFRMTALVPMAAGLLEQMLCRPISEPE